MDKEYVLTIGVDKFYLTEKERDFYLEAIDRGVKYVKFPDGRLLGTNFQSLVHKKALEGKWFCESKQWHSQGAECFCTTQFEELPDGRIRITEKSLR